MGRGSAPAETAANSANQISGQAAGNAGSLYGTLAPQLQAEAAAPAGIAQPDLAAMNTGVQESAGGTQAAAVGQGGLLAARTRNAGGADAAIADASRGAGETAAKGALGTQIANSQVKQRQQQAGLGGLESLYGTNEGSSIGALGEVAGNVNADVNQQNASYDWTRALSAISQAAQAGAAFK